MKTNYYYNYYFLYNIIIVPCAQLTLVVMQMKNNNNNNNNSDENKIIRAQNEQRLAKGQDQELRKALAMGFLRKTWELPMTRGSFDSVKCLIK